jgi:hypothetical protein
MMGAMLGWDESCRWREMESMGTLYRTREAA